MINQTTSTAEYHNFHNTHLLIAFSNENVFSHRLCGVLMRSECGSEYRKLYLRQKFGLGQSWAALLAQKSCVSHIRSHRRANSNDIRILRNIYELLLLEVTQPSEKYQHYRV